MNELIENLACEAGFEFDPRDRNFYGSDSDHLNKSIIELTKLVAKRCLDNMQNEDGDLDFAVWKTKRDFGI